MNILVCDGDLKSDDNVGFFLPNSNEEVTYFYFDENHSIVITKNDVVLVLFTNNLRKFNRIEENGKIIVFHGNQLVYQINFRK